jgi:hypothetical protein
MLFALPSGCSPQSQPPGPTAAASSLSSPAQSARPAAAEKPPAKPAKKSPRRQPPRLRDDLNLPLVIKIEAPPVPPEIQKPSPPIQEPPKTP